jgi:putative oxidoreductase
MNFMLRILRVIVGALFIGHGTQKLFGWFGGHGPEGTGQFFESLGLRPGRRNALAAGASEAGGGALLAMGGPITPLASAALTGTMITAVRTVHWEKGIWSSEGGFEYNLVLMGALAAITAEETSLPLAVASIAAGAIGSVAVVELGRRFEAETAEPSPEPGVPAEAEVATAHA